MLLSTRQQELIQLLNPSVEALGFVLLGLEHIASGGHALLRLYIEHAERPIVVEDCEAVSHAVSVVLDQADPIGGQYDLEVSSPGVDRPLYTPAQFERALGEKLSLETHAPIENRRRFKGKLLAVLERGVELLVDKANITLDWRDLSKARVVPDYQALMKAAKRAQPKLASEAKARPKGPRKSPKNRQEPASSSSPTPNKPRKRSR
jgi:ribosome maturation factor RimP